MPTSDEDLLVAAVRGDRSALTALLERYSPAVRQKLAGAIPAQWQSVLSLDDVMQEAYIDAILDIRQLKADNGEAFLAWLTTLANRTLLDTLRMLGAEKRGGDRRRIHPSTGGDSTTTLYQSLVEASSTASRGAARKEALEALEQALGQLPEIYRQVVRLYDLEGLTAKEVGELVERSPGAVFMLRARAHRRLREILGSGSRYF
ncbi:MAG: sigma-70 family RNA polymerase sigma factor [Planctomycetes bacterium]|nr:sigma-70 family RNA polymerase sigma factor [Planctomycetota bacterium]